MTDKDGDGSTPAEAQHLRWPDDAPSEQTADVLRALGHPVRLRIVWLLVHGRDFGLEDHPCCESGVVCVCRIKSFFDISAPNLSHHLKVLRHAGLVDTRRIGIWTHYHMRPQALEPALELLSTLRAPGDPQLTAVAADEQDEVPAQRGSDDGTGHAR